jgi:hypothetical protein
MQQDDSLKSFRWVLKIKQYKNLKFKDRIHEKYHMLSRRMI